MDVNIREFELGDVPAIKLYEKFGFRELRRSIYYGMRVGDVRNLEEK